MESSGFVSTSAVYARFFVGNEDLGNDDGYRAVHALEDDELAQDSLQCVLEGKLQIRPQFSALTGRALRKAVREARYGGDAQVV